MTELEKLQVAREQFDADMLALSTGGATEPKAYARLESGIVDRYRGTLEAVYNNAGNELDELETRIDQAQAHPVESLTDAELREAGSLLSSFQEATQSLSTADLVTKARMVTDKASAWAYM